MVTSFSNTNNSIHLFVHKDQLGVKYSMKEYLKAFNCGQMNERYQIEL